MLLHFLELQFLKLFLTYPLINGLYLGVEGGYFIEGESKIKIQNGANETNDIDRDMWTDSDFSEFDYEPYSHANQIKQILSIYFTIEPCSFGEYDIYQEQ